MLISKNCFCTFLVGWMDKSWLSNLVLLAVLKVRKVVFFGWNGWMFGCFFNAQKWSSLGIGWEGFESVGIGSSKMTPGQDT